MPAAFYDEEVVQVGDETFTMAIDFRSIDIIEHLVGESGTITPMPEVVAMLYSDPIPLSVGGKVLWALLRRHHETLTLDEAAGLMFCKDANRVAQAMLTLINRAMNLGPSKKAKDENPRKRRGASAIS